MVIEGIARRHALGLRGPAAPGSILAIYAMSAQDSYLGITLGVMTATVVSFLISAVAGIGIVYAIGVPWYAAASGMDLLSAFTTSVLAFIPGDLIKAGIAAAVIVLVKRSYPLIRGRVATSH